MSDEAVLVESQGDFGSYKVVDCVYAGRPARVLYSGNHLAAQSGVAHDDRPELLFDYNERFMEIIRGLKPERVLLIGGGAFTLPKALLEEFPDTIIDIVEPERVLLGVARKYFDYEPSENTRIYHEEGRRFLKKSRGKYDLIIVDAFKNAEVPVSLVTVEAMTELKRHLRSDGVAAMNIIASYHGERSRVLRRAVAAFQRVFDSNLVFPASASVSLWTPQNFVCTASNGHADLEAFVRYQAQEPPEITGDDVVTDEEIATKAAC